MAYWFSTQTNTVYEGDCQPGDVTATDEQMAAWQANNAKVALIAQAQSALDASDITFIRCVEEGLTWPQEWKEYRTALRAMVSTGAGTMPARPAWPSAS